MAGDRPRSRKADALAWQAEQAKEEPPPTPMFSGEELKETKALIAAHQAGFAAVMARPEEIAWILRAVRAK